MHSVDPKPVRSESSAPAEQAAPYFEFRIGGFRLTAPQMPVRFIMLLVPLGASAAGWFLDH